MKRAGRTQAERDFAIVLAAVAGAVAQVLGTAIEIGRAAGWWP
jgi:hypothetical protein